LSSCGRFNAVSIARFSSERERRSRPGRFHTSPQQYWVTSSCMSMVKSVALLIDAST